MVVVVPRAVEVGVVVAAVASPHVVMVVPVPISRRRRGAASRACGAPSEGHWVRVRIPVVIPDLVERRRGSPRWRAGQRLKV